MIEQDHREDERERGRRAVAGRLREGPVVGVDAQVVLVPVAELADDDVDLREHAEVPDDREQQQDQEDRLEQRVGDPPEDPPRPGAVDAGGLVQLGGHGLQPGQHGDGDERETLPQQEHGEQRVSGQRGVGPAEAGPVRAAAQPVRQPAQRPVHHPAVRVGQPDEDDAGRDRGRGPGQQRGAGHEGRHPAAEPVQQQADQGSGQQRQRHYDRREDQADPQRQPELGVRQDRGVVARADPVGTPQRPLPAAARSSGTRRARSGRRARAPARRSRASMAAARCRAPGDGGGSARRCAPARCTGRRAPTRKPGQPGFWVRPGGAGGQPGIPPAGRKRFSPSGE